VSWASSADRDGIPYHFYNRLLQDTTTINGIIGTAYDIARVDFMDNTGFWLPAYHYNLFGDPALRQLGQLVNVEENTMQRPSPLFTVFPNPSDGVITIRMQSPQSSEIELDVYDISGRLVKRIQSAETGESVSLSIELPAGMYFVRCIHGENDYQSKIVIIE
jgi:hypothetical protein